MSDAMTGFERRTFGAPVVGGHRVSHDVYERGEGPPVVIIQELPGIGPETLRLADRLVGSGFRVVLPHLFGPLGRVSVLGNMVRVLCMRKELHLLATNASSPLVDWLRALCRELRSTHEVSGVGVVGMCLTGNFAISLMADDSVLAAVASQPSLPMFRSQAALHMSDSEIAAARQRLSEVGPMLSYRFEGDPVCRAAKFEAIAEAFNDDGRERVKLVTLPGKGHSVLTRDFVDEAGHPTTEALNEVIEYFGDKLKRG